MGRDLRAEYAALLIDIMEARPGAPDPELMRTCETVLFGASLAPPEPDEASYGWRWTATSGRWHVSLNRHGDTYVSDSRIAADDRAELLAVVHAAHAFAADLPADTPAADGGGAQ